MLEVYSIRQYESSNIVQEQQLYTTNYSYTDITSIVKMQTDGKLSVASIFGCLLLPDFLIFSNSIEELREILMRIRTAVLSITSILALGLSGCGGGGSTAPAGPVTSTLTFPLLSAYQTLTANGFTKNFTISGNCSGTGTDTEAPASTATTFEGTSALSAGSAITWTYSNCTPASNAVTSTTYYDSNYMPLGGSGDSYGVFLTPVSLPTSVTVGSTGTIGTETLYTDNTKTTGAGRSDFSYVIEADTSTTAIVNLIQKEYNTANSLIITGQSRYRITATGALTPVSIDFQAGTHELWTYN
jgi:hypothetical protein